MTVNLTTTSLMAVVLIAELAATHWARTQLKKDRKMQAERAKIEDEMESQRNKAYLMDVRSEDQHGVNGF